MGIEPKLLFGKVRHKRLFPKINAFSYAIYYLALPLSKLNQLPIAHNRFGLLSFHTKDHGHRDGSDIEKWARDILTSFGITKANGEIILICMPRVLGYVFNPVSFWLCHDKKEKVRAILCEVNNTFGETHTYMCVHPDHREITKDETIKGKKLFHVSPFMKREGSYNFRFDITKERYSIFIDYADEKANTQLKTVLSGQLESMFKNTLSKAFWRYPLVTFKSIYLIHWQALKLITKGIKYIPKPQQNNEKISTTHPIEKE